MAVITIYKQYTTADGKLKFGGACHTHKDVDTMKKELEDELKKKLNLAAVESLTITNGDFSGLGTPN